MKTQANIAKDEVIFSGAKLDLIKAAEELIAEFGLAGISDREIARHAGQKNNSAVAYHFGDRQGLLAEILDYRMIPLNKQRHQLLAQEGLNLHGLISAFVNPYLQHLLNGPADSFYISLISQLYQSGQQALLINERRRSSSLLLLGQKAADLLPELSQEQLFNRLTFAGTQLIHSLALWDVERRRNPKQWTDVVLQSQAEQLIDFIVAGLAQNDLRLS